MTHARWPLGAAVLVFALAGVPTRDAEASCGDYCNGTYCESTDTCTYVQSCTTTWVPRQINNGQKGDIILHTSDGPVRVVVNAVGDEFSHTGVFLTSSEMVHNTSYLDTNILEMLRGLVAPSTNIFTLLNWLWCGLTGCDVVGYGDIYVAPDTLYNAGGMERRNMDYWTTTTTKLLKRLVPSAAEAIADKMLLMLQTPVYPGLSHASHNYAFHALKDPAFESDYQICQGTVCLYGMCYPAACRRPGSQCSGAIAFASRNAGIAYPFRNYTNSQAQVQLATSALYTNLYNFGTTLLATPGTVIGGKSAGSLSASEKVNVVRTLVDQVVGCFNYGGAWGTDQYGSPHWWACMKASSWSGGAANWAARPLGALVAVSPDTLLKHQTRTGYPSAYKNNIVEAPSISGGYYQQNCTYSYACQWDSACSSSGCDAQGYPGCTCVTDCATCCGGGKFPEPY